MSNTIDLSKPFLLPIDQAAKTLGVSKYWLRSGIKNGTIPHVTAGTKYLINIPLTIEKINAESVANANGQI